MPKAAQHHALARQWQVLRLLPTKPPGITSRELVEKLEREGFTVTKRTVERDLAELSTIFGIACNDKGMPYGWHWMKGEYADLPGLSVSDAVSLRLVEDLLRPLLPSAMLESLESRFQQAKNKLASLASDNEAARWINKVRYIPPTLPALPPRIDNHLLETVQEALLTEHQIEVEYRKPSSEMPQSLCLHPLALLQRGTITYLAATAFGYNDIRLYALHRMAAAEVLPEKSLHPACFSLDAYLDSGALQFTNGNTIVFKAWVQESLAAILRETPLGTDQTLEKRGERSLLRVTIKDSWQLVWWVLSQGEMIEVLSPCNLRLQIADVASNMHSQYSDNRIEEEDEHS